MSATATESTHAQVVGLAREGLTVAQIAERLRLDRALVYTILDEAREDASPEASGGGASPAPRPADDVVARALRLDDKRIRRLAERAQAALAAVREALTEWEAKAEARAEVARLERQLAQARERAGVRARRPRPAGAPTPRAPRGEPVDCRKCGRTCANPQGRVAHERHCTGG